MSIRFQSVGYGHIAGLSINKERGVFSQPRQRITIGATGIQGDIYNSPWRTLGPHDGNYIATDGLSVGDIVRNHRQITILDINEINQANKMLRYKVVQTMARENILIETQFLLDGLFFSKLPPMSRMVIGDKSKKVLNLTEENVPCRTMARPIANYYARMHRNLNKDTFAEEIVTALTNRRGQMAEVKTEKTTQVREGDRFQIFLPM